MAKMIIGFDIQFYRKNDIDGEHLIAEYSTYMFNNKVGDMCKECSDKLLSRILTFIKDLGFPERYEQADVNKLKNILKEEAE